MDSSQPSLFLLKAYIYAFPNVVSYSQCYINVLFYMDYV